MEWHWVDNVLYFEYIEYDPELDAFTVAKAQIHVPDRTHHRHRLTLVIVVFNREIAIAGMSLDTAIAQARPLLQRLVEEHRTVADRLTTDASRSFDLSGRRLR